jgi:uncharacterized protein
METNSPPDQAETITFLMRPASFDEPVHTVERIDTHGAMIFLAGSRAYKLKRSVKLPYLDFSTPDLRRRVCEREFELNRRTAPGLYLDVLTIRRDAGGELHFGGQGEAVDTVVVMKRFPDSALLDRMSKAGKLDPSLMQPLAHTIRQFHEAAERMPNAPWVQTLSDIIDTLDETLLDSDAAPLSPPAESYLTALRQELKSRNSLLLARQADGYVRRCHGDLHLKNIVLLDGAPVLFDALEFDDDLIAIDVLYDLAFLLMDLWHRGNLQEANAVLNAYFDEEASAGAWAGLRLMPLFLSLRAAIRAMVGVHGLGVAGERRRGEAEEGIRAYAALAADLLRAQPPRVICVGGLSGTGKTGVARGLAPEVGAVPGAIHLRSDVERKRMFGKAPETRLPANAYGEAANQAVYRRVMDRAAAVLNAGHSVIIDAGFRQPDEREAAAQLARQACVPFLGLWLEADAERMLARVEQRRGDASDAGREVVLQQLRSRIVPPHDWASIDANGRPEQTLAYARIACSALP